MFRRRKSLHIGTDFGNDSDGSEVTADARSGLKNGKFLLIGSGERKNEFFKLCFPGFEVIIMIFDDLEFASLFRSDVAVNGITELWKFLSSNFCKQEVQGQKKYLRDFPKVYPVSPEQICRRCRDNVSQLDIGNRETVLQTILFA